MLGNIEIFLARMKHIGSEIKGGGFNFICVIYTVSVHGLAGHAMPVKPSQKAIGKSRGSRAGQRNVLQRSTGKYTLHDAGFVACVLEDYKQRVQVKPFENSHWRAMMVAA